MIQPGFGKKKEGSRIVKFESLLLKNEQMRTVAAK